MKDKVRNIMAPLRILAVGDIMAGDTPLRFGFGAGTSLLKVGCEQMARRLKALLHPADLIIGNLESPLGSIPWPMTDYANHQLLADTSVARALSLAGVNVLNIANNHIMQHGRERFDETVAALTAEGIAIVGRSVSGFSQPYRLTINGVRIVIFGFSLRPEVYSTRSLPYAQADSPERLVASVERCGADWDLCIVCLHWGAEYMNYPAPSQTQISELLFKAGVDIILGHHPHVLQPVEVFEGKLVAYSLGNFVFDMWRPWVRQSAVLDVTWSCDRRVQSVTARAVLIAVDGWPDPAPASEAIRVEEALGLNGDRSSFRYPDSEAGYWKRAGRAEMINALHNRCFFLSHLFTYCPAVRVAAIKNFFLRRMKSR